MESKNIKTNGDIDETLLTLDASGLGAIVGSSQRRLFDEAETAQEHDSGLNAEDDY